MSVKRLQELGFKESDCIKALQATTGRLEASATWLLENATPVNQLQNSQQDSSAQGWQFAGFEVSWILLLDYRCSYIAVLKKSEFYSKPRHSDTDWEATTTKKK